MINKIKEILLHYGNKHQKRKTIEELAELIIAISKNDRKNIIEEIADVSIMITQLNFIYLIDKNEIEEKMNEKIERTLFKIKQGKG